jgi:hypothetical protein
VKNGDLDLSMCNGMLVENETVNIDVSFNEFIYIKYLIFFPLVLVLHSAENIHYAFLFFEEYNFLMYYTHSYIY